MQKEIHVVKSKKVGRYWTVAFFIWALVFSGIMFMLYQTEIKAQDLNEQTGTTSYNKLK